MNTLPRRKRRNTKTLDAMKVGAVLFLIFIGILLFVWLGMQILRPPEEPPDLKAQPGHSMWDPPPTHR